MSERRVLEWFAKDQPYEFAKLALVLAQVCNEFKDQPDLLDEFLDNYGFDVGNSDTGEADLSISWREFMVFLKSREVEH